VYSFTSDVGEKLGQSGIAPIDHPNPGHGYYGTLVYAATPTASRKALETATALGDNQLPAYYYLADSARRSGSPDIAQTAIEQALKQAPNDPRIRSLSEPAGNKLSTPWLESLLNGTLPLVP